MRLIQKALEPVWDRMLGTVWIDQSKPYLYAIVANFRDHSRVQERLRTLDPNAKVRVRKEVAFPKTPKVRRGAFKDGNPGLIRLPSGTSRVPWPAAWIGRGEADALESADIPKSWTWPS